MTAKEETKNSVIYSDIFAIGIYAEMVETISNYYEEDLNDICDLSLHLLKINDEKKNSNRLFTENDLGKRVKEYMFQIHPVLKNYDDSDDTIFDAINSRYSDLYDEIKSNENIYNTSEYYWMIGEVISLNKNMIKNILEQFNIVVNNILENAKE